MEIYQEKVLLYIIDTILTVNIRITKFVRQAVCYVFSYINDIYDLKEKLIPIEF